MKQNPWFRRPTIPFQRTASIAVSWRHNVMGILCRLLVLFIELIRVSCDSKLSNDTWFVLERKDFDWVLAPEACRDAVESEMANSTTKRQEITIYSIYFIWASQRASLLNACSGPKSQPQTLFEDEDAQCHSSAMSFRSVVGLATHL
jgi:hypothetical protein